MDIPVDLLRTIDEGGNPDVFTAGIFERANRSNQLSKGKAQAFAGFRCSLPHMPPARVAFLATVVSTDWSAWPMPGPGSRRMTANRESPQCMPSASLACRDGLLRAAEASYPAEAEAYKALQPAQRKEP